MSGSEQDIQELRKMVQDGFKGLLDKIEAQSAKVASQKSIEDGLRGLSEKIEAQNAMIEAQGETLKNMVKEVGNTPIKFPAPEKLPGMEDEDRPDEVCYCGNILMADAEFCRKCGRKRPDPPAESEAGSEPQEDANGTKEDGQEEIPTENKQPTENDQKEDEADPDSARPSSLARSGTASSENLAAPKKRATASVAKGFASSKSFQEELLKAEAAKSSSYMADMYGARRMHFDKLRDLTRSKNFQITFAIMVALNAIFTGYTTDLSARGVVDTYFKKVRTANSTGVPFDDINDSWEMPDWPVFVDITFATIFSIEIGMRIIGEEIMFFVGPDWFWNNADFILVLVAILELALFALDVDMSVIRLVRLTRIGRTVRMVRLLKYLRDLRIMLISVGHSLLPLLWATLFLSGMLSVFAIVFMLACTNYMETAGPLHGAGSNKENSDIVDTVTAYFNTFPMTFLSLFMSVTGGISWWELNEPLSNIHPALGLLYLFFILFVILAVLNIITAIFVESATALAQTDKDLVTIRQQEQTTKYISELRDVFLELDQDGGGTLTLEEFEARADDPQVIAYFEALEIDAMKASEFFKLFDMDGSGELEIEEFIAGCMRIKGGAKAVDIETIMHENQKLMSHFRQFFDRSARSFARIERMVQAMYQHTFAKFTELDEGMLKSQKSLTDLEEKVKNPVNAQSLNGTAAGWVI